MKVLLGVILTMFGFSSTKYVHLKDIDLMNFELRKCDDSFQPVLVENITIQVGANRHVHVGGTLRTLEDLFSPLKASVSLKKEFFFGWLPVPCEDNMGSCVYNDLCAYGYPEDEDCPEEFIKNRVPCRCPIDRGNYTLPLVKYLMSNNKWMLTGKYKGTVVVSHLGQKLACYNVWFMLKQQTNEV